MSITNLPQDIFPSAKKLDNLIFHNYKAEVGAFKGKSIIHMNAISLVLTGEKTILYADKSIHIKDNEFHFLSAGHCLASMQLSEKKIFSSILIFFDNKILTDFYLKHDVLIARIRAKQKITPAHYIGFKKDAFVLNFIDSLKLLFQSGEGITYEMKLVKFEELMLHLLYKYPHQILSFQSNKPDSFSDFEIRKAVETNIANNVSVEELAFLCKLSLSTFKRRFAKLYGTSPNKWILQQRMEMAKNLLSHYDQKPSEVYYKVGYENHSSFTQSFRQTFGITPKEFQQQQLTVQE
ncbi:MAG TPA: AraC family transcriptional regulator [Cyclobacteriaceae bacterium]|jgi:AraC-like DNA-binding protein|nr:AraC family transcriptional regulator [Cyclobacteriaceae bacterium]